MCIKNNSKKWLIITCISFFIFSVAYPTRFLLTSNQFSILISSLAIPLIYAAFQLFYIWKHQDFITYADILNFLENQKKHQPNLGQDSWFAVGLVVFIFMLFFVGTVVSTLLFWKKWVYAHFFWF